MATTGFHHRLRKAIDHWGQGHRAFAREMAKTGLRGTSYRTLVNYLKGVHQPSKAWISAAARTLLVSEPFLVAGDGPMLPISSDETRGYWDEEELGGLRQAVDLVFGAETVGTWEPSTFFSLTLAMRRFEESISEVQQPLTARQRGIARAYFLQVALTPVGLIPGPSGFEKGDSERMRVGLTLLFQGMAAMSAPPGQGPAWGHIRRSAEAEAERVGLAGEPLP